MNWFYIFIGLLGGAALPFQVGVNTQLRKLVQSPILAAVVSFAVGLVALVLYAISTRMPWNGIERASYGPWWIWLGGILGAFYLVSTVLVGPRIGAAALVGLVVTGQLITSLVIDHFGLVGFPVHHANPIRILGAILLVVGVVLIQKF